MSGLFLEIVNMSISAGWIVLAVLLLRLLLKKAPKWIAVLLWGVVAVRLICPFTVESVMSLIPSAETVSPEIMTSPTPEIHTGVSILNSTINPVISQSFAPTPEASANPLQIWIAVLAHIWVIGVSAMLLYTAISYLRVKRRVQTAVLLRENLYQSENVSSPFVLGLFRPRIYLPFSVKGQDMEHVIAHERAHLRRRDHLWKPLGFFLLAIHWFNPLMWLGYVLLCRDIELACDEKVIRDFDDLQKADYSQALLSCSVNRRMIAACPLAFGEVGVKDRVKSVLNYKRPAFWIVVLAIASSIALAVCFLTDPKKEEIPGLSVTDSGSDVEGVSLEITDADLTETDPYLTVKWIVEGDRPVEFGEKFEIFYESDGEWKNCSIDPDPVWHLVSHLAASSAEHTYRLGGQDMTEPGKYRLEAPFNLQGESKTQYRAWIEFELEKGVEGLVPHLFRAKKLTFYDGSYSFVQYEAESQYMIANMLELYEVNDGRISQSLGSLEEIELDGDRFDSRFRRGGVWSGKESLEGLKKKNKRAWQLYGTLEDATPKLYLLLEQEDGTFYLGYGYYNCNSVRPENPDDSHIRWLYRLEESDEQVTHIGTEILEYDGSEVIEEAPAMIVVSNEQSIVAQKGSQSWTYRDEKGAVTVCGDGTHPLNALKTMPCIDILPTYASYGDPLGACLTFNATGFDPILHVPPTELWIRCWEKEKWGSAGEDGDLIGLNVVNGNLFFTLKDGSYVYEVTAIWEDNGKFHGQASYTFRAAKSDLNWDSYPKIGVNSKVMTTYERTETELIDETYERGDFVISKTYHQMDDGLWVQNSRGYMYCLEVTGKMHGAEKHTTFRILSNRKDITFDEAWKAAGFSSNTEDYFSPSEAVIVGRRIFD